MYPAAEAEILARVAAYGTAVATTRYVAPSSPDGAWVPYFEQFPWALVPPDDPLYALTPAVAEVVADRPEMTATTFGKWGLGLATALEQATAGRLVEHVEVVGLATDCCVLSTVLAMADAGIAVTVRAAGCGGSTPENHERALAVMDLYAPLVTVARG